MSANRPPAGFSSPTRPWVIPARAEGPQAPALSTCSLAAESAESFALKGVLLFDPPRGRLQSPIF